MKDNWLKMWNDRYEKEEYAYGISPQAFGKNHLGYQMKNEKVGSPKNVEALFSTKELQSDFKDYEVILLEEKEIELSEGLYHNGKGSATRFVGLKK